MTTANEHSHLFRQARPDDLPELYALNKLADENGRLTQADIRRCLKDNAAGQWVVEAAGRVVAAIYSQRLPSVEALEGHEARNALQLHDAKGTVVQVLAWVVGAAEAPDTSRLLLSRALEAYRASPEVERIILVASCEGATLPPDETADEAVLWEAVDATLGLYRTLGARILRRVPGYRAKTSSHEGCGLLLDCTVPASSLTSGPYLFVLSAATTERLRAYAGKVIGWLENDLPEGAFQNAIFTWQTGRTSMKQRLALEVVDAAELCERLRQWLAGSRGIPGMWSTETSQDSAETSETSSGLSALASAWVAGGEASWQSLYVSLPVAPRRISVPTYPFAATRHWVAADADTPLPALSSNAPAPQGTLRLVPVWEAQTVESAGTSPGGSAPAHHVVLVSGFEQFGLEALRTAQPEIEWRRLPMPVADDGMAYIDMVQATLEAVKDACQSRRDGWVLIQVLIEETADAWVVGGLSGLLRTAAEEYSDCIGQIIFSDATSTQEITRKLADEARQGNIVTVRYHEGGRQRRTWLTGEESPRARPALREGGVYCVTGGLGGLGVLVAAELLRRGRGAKVTLVGRSALAGDAQTRFQSLQALAAAQPGSSIDYRSLDITDPKAVADLITDIVQSHGHLHGIVHAAGVLDDGFMSSKTPETIRKVLTPKVLGAIHLDVASRSQQLDFFVHFASMAGVIGNAGQADYAAANAFLDWFAVARNQRVAAGQAYGRTVSIDWPLWQDGGMQLPVDMLALLMRNTGTVPMDTETGMGFFFDCLSTVSDQVFVLQGDIARMQAWLAQTLHPVRQETAAVADTAVSGSLLEATQRELVRLFAEATERSAEQIDPYDSMENYGLDSIIISKLNASLTDVFPGLSKTLFFEFRTLATLSEHLLARQADACRKWTAHSDVVVGSADIHLPARALPERVVSHVESKSREPIAIIGLSGMYPKANDLDAFWQNLRDGRDCIEEIPAERWSLDGFFEPDVGRAIEQGKSYSRWGGFVDAFADFDPLFFNISPREAMNIDPQERLFLQECWRTLESAGYTRDDLKSRFGGRVGVFAGITKTGYQLYMLHPTRDGEPFLPYTSFSSTANRVSYFLDISGPSMPVDTMCSSSLTAIHEACEHILRDECEMAFAGGVNLYLHPRTYELLCSQNMLSTDGRCRSFGTGGDGYVPGEGAGAVLLKRLSDAERDGDPIHGVILASQVNHGGRTHGYTVPNPNAQAALIRASIEAAGIDAQAISYIETHGTGTELGDPIEITGLEHAFETAAGSDFRCRIGAVKSNIGHLEAASGIAGLTKILLQMRHAQLVPSLHAETLNPNIDWQHNVFEVNTRLQDWPSPATGKPRIAAVSSFGASGTNAHVIVQEYREQAAVPQVSKRSEPVLVPLSAKTAPQLAQRVRDLLAFVRDAKVAPDLEALAYTLQVGREAMEDRLCCLVRSLDELTDTLQSYLNGSTGNEHLHIGQVAAHRDAMRMFTRDDDFKETVQRWIARRKLDRLAELWSRGLDIDWQALHSHRPFRLALPTYPFAHERLWVDTRVMPMVESGTPASALHPLVHTNVSDLYRQAYTSVLTGTESCLRDHVVGGDKILPAVAYLEMVRTAMALAMPGAAADQVIELRNTVWAKPLIVAGPHPVEIVLQPDAESGSIAFTIASTAQSQEGDSTDNADTGQMHCQGEAAFVTDTANPIIDLRRLEARMDQGRVDADTVYGMFSSVGVAFGPAHRALRAVTLGTDEALAQLYLPDVVSPADPRYVLHPSLVDSALQACSCLGRSAQGEAGAPLLPFALDSLRVIAPCQSDMVAWVRRAASGSDNPDAPLHFDIDILDTDGRLCVQMRGFTARPRGGSASQQDAKPRTHALVPVWNRVDPAQSSSGASTTQRLVVAGNEDALRWVKQSFPDAEALLLASMTDENSLTGFLQNNVDHLLWVAPDVLDASQNTDVDTASALAGLRDVFNLVKAALPLAQTPRWTFLTRSTQAVHADDRIAPRNAGIAGFVGSLSREYPHWDIRLLDVDSLDTLTARDCNDIAGDATAANLAYRDGEWFQRGLGSLEATPASHDGYRQGGTYVVVGGAGGIGVAWSRYMIERYNARLVWIGRRSLDAGIAANIEALAALGHAPMYVSADATDLDALQQAAERIRATYPVVHGVVHSAIDLRDQSLAQMDAAELERAVAAKMAVAIHLDTVFGEQDLDFVMFFSSMISFTTGAGQANYAAGSTFADGFALALAQRRPYPVKIMNWGYWGGVGVVADPFHQERMRKMGIGSIDAPEAMAALQTLVDHPGLSQMAVIKTLNPQALASFVLPERVGGRHRASSSHLPDAVNDARAVLAVPAEQAIRDDMLDEDVDALSVDILVSALAGLGVVITDAYEKAAAHIHPAHARWLQTSLDLAKTQNRAPRAWDELWREWESRKASWMTNPRCRAQLLLLESCLRALPEILSGNRAATDVIFPNASMEHVQGVYEGHALADCCNNAVGELLVAWLRRQPSTNKIRILEIGAGTGGTTKNLLPRLARFGDRIEEYCYTDLSKAFLIHAETQFRALCPGLNPRIFDVSRAPLQQGIEAGRYDVVVATNVLHATPDIRQTLRHAKAVLRPGGIVLINEMTGWSLLRHMTFGLLEGWWLYEDEALREPGSPGLAVETWRRQLACEGFDDIALVVPEAHAFGQLVVAGASDGLWRQRMSPVAPTASSAPAPARLAAPVAAVAPEIRRDAATNNTKAVVEKGAQGSVRDRCLAHLRHAVAGVLRLDETRVSPNQPLADYGLDSILVIGLTSQLRKAFPAITSTLFFEAGNLSDLADMLLRSYPEQAEQLFGQQEAGDSVSREVKPAQAALPSRSLRLSAPAAASNASAVAPLHAASIFDVAIIGLSGRYPMANDMETFWDNLSQGRHCVSEIPPDRWDWRRFHDEDPDAAGTIYTRWGGFLDHIDQFDPLFFRISPKDAKAMDPQERQFLQVCYHAIEDAGYRPDTLARPDKVGVFVGVMNARYTAQPLHYSIANRVSFALDFRGPSVAVDTACSSSLTAIHFALDSLYSGLSECVIAGGVNLIVDAGHFQELTAVGMLSHDDRCRAFGAGADGFVDAEGVGAVVLKPLAQAERDGDLIYGVIKASAINAGGRTNGYTVPNPVAQAAVVSEALRRANVPASDVSCIEAHGTGTALGDPIEVAGLRRAFEMDTQERGFCAIGSLKSNFGHCESAAGIAALTKVLLQLKHGQLVPTLHAEAVNPEIDFAQTPFRLQRHLQNWNRLVRNVDGQSREVPRIAGISSFGAGGANAHLIVQEYVPSASRRTSGAAHDDGVLDHAVVVPLSARTADQLAHKVRDLLAFFERAKQRGDVVSLSSLAYTLQVGREERDERLAIVVNSLDALMTALQRSRDSVDGVAIHRGRVSRDGPVADTAVRAADAGTAAQLARDWVTGTAVDWAGAYDSDHRPARLHLPGYPFSQDSYWQPIERNEIVVARSDVAPASPPPADLGVAGLPQAGANQFVAAQPTMLHPLVHRNMSTLAGTAYETIVSHADRIASDHHLDVGAFHGHAIPAAVYLEMTRAALADAMAGEASSGARVIELSETTWAAPAVFEDALTLRVALVTRADGAIAYEIDSPSPEGQGSVLCQGLARALDVVEPQHLDLKALIARTQGARWDSNAFYLDQSRSGLAYGPVYRSLMDVRTGVNEVLAELRLSQDLALEQAALDMHPVLLDGAMQAASTLLPIAVPPSLPWRLASIRRFRPCSSHMFAWVRPSTAVAVSGLDIDLCDIDGRICVQLRGLSHGALDVGDPVSERMEEVAPITLTIVADTAPVQIEESKPKLKPKLTLEEQAEPEVAATDSRRVALASLDDVRVGEPTTAKSPRIKLSFDV